MQGIPLGPATAAIAGVGPGAMRPMSSWHVSRSLSRAAAVASSANAATAWRRSARVARAAIAGGRRARTFAARGAP
eukprot:5417931-Pyramimonas_sp.AAC.1